MPYIENDELVRWLGKAFMLGREGPSDLNADFFFDFNDQALKARKIYLTDVGDPPDLALRRIGPDNSPWDLRREEFQAVADGQNIGAVYWQAFDGEGFGGRNAMVYCRARGPQAPGSTGGSIVLSSTPIGSPHPRDRVEIEPDGTLNLSGVPTEYHDNLACVRVRTSDGKLRRMVLA